MSTRTLPKAHSWRRLERREERVRQYYENKSTRRARWTNTGRPCWGRTTADQISNCSYILCKLGWTGVWFINAKEKCKNTGLQDALMCGFNHGKQQALRQESEEERRFVFCNSPLFGSRICTPASRAHCWRTSSSGRSAPPGSFAPGTQLQIHLEGLDKNKTDKKKWQTSRGWKPALKIKTVDLCEKTTARP